MSFLVRRHVLLLILLFSAMHCFARGGVLSGTTGKIKVVQTQYFDIIFPEECQSSAQVIAEVCDEYYIEICQILEYKPYHRFPVTITPCVEVSNAYYTVVPYSRIVLYDTKPTESLDMYENTLKKMFYHELTHAVTMNLKGKFMRGIGAVFGDVLDFVYLNFSTFWNEGATVSFESRGIDGRLNDSFSTQIVSASIVENVFPSWRDVTGARDIYPSGESAYIYGGLFARYLQDKYGMSKYGEFWKKANSRLTIGFCASVFKKVYGVSVTEEWKQFKNSIYVPSQTKEEWNQIAHLVSGQDALVKTMDSYWQNENGLVYYDSKSQGLYDVGQKNTVKRISSVSAVTSLRFEDAGKVKLTRNVTKDNIKIENGSFDLKTKKYSVYDHSKPVDDGVYSLIELGEKSYGIKKQGLKWTIFVNENGILRHYDLSEVFSMQMVIHNLHYAIDSEKKQILTFTWTQLGAAQSMVSRTGRIEISPSGQVKAFLQKNDFLFGVVDFLFDGNQYYGTVQKFDCIPLYALDMDGVEYEEKLIEAVFLDDCGAEPSSSGIAFNPKNYNPLKYYLKGIRLPVGTVSIVDRNFEEVDLAWLGATYVSSNPWGDKILFLSGGYSLEVDMPALYAKFSGGDSTFNYSLAATYVFDPKSSYKQTNEEIFLSKTIYTGFISRYGIEALGRLYYSTNEKYMDSSMFDTKVVDSRLGIFYSNMHKVGDETFSVAGITFEPFIDFQKNWLSFQDVRRNFGYANVGMDLVLKQKVFLPLILRARLYPKRNYFFYGNFEAILYDLEVQKGIPALSIFIDRLVLSASYDSWFKYQSEENFDIKNSEKIVKKLGKDNYYDEVNIRLDIVSGLNFGYFATSDTQFKFGFVFRYRFHDPDKNTGYLFGISSAIAY